LWERMHDLKEDGDGMEEKTEMTAAADTHEHVNQDSQGGERKPFAEPVLTRHEPLTNVTLFTSGLNVAGVTFF